MGALGVPRGGEVRSSIGQKKNGGAASEECTAPPLSRVLNTKTERENHGFSWGKDYTRFAKPNAPENSRRILGIQQLPGERYSKGGDIGAGGNRRTPEARISESPPLKQ